MEKQEEYKIILDYLNYLLKEYGLELKQGCAKEIIEAQATYYSRLVDIYKEKKAMTKEEVLKAIEDLEERMKIKEMSDDMYYTCGTYAEDDRKLNQLKNLLKEFE